MITDFDPFTFFSRHLAALSCTRHHPDGASPAHPVVITGFVISVRDTWFWVSAGHWFTDLERSKGAGYRYETWYLDDVLAEQTCREDRIPFPYDSFVEGASFSLDETEGESPSGVDFAFVELVPNHRALLAARGVEALDERGWTKGLPDEFDFGYLLGVPSELVHGTVLKDALVQEAEIRRVPVLPVPPPQDPKNGSGMLLYFRIPEELGHGNLVGMSGGPILGFRPDRASELRYWAVGIQSRKLQGQSVICAMPVRVVAEFIGRWWLEGGREVVRSGQEPRSQVHRF